MSWPDADDYVQAALSGADAFEDAELREAPAARDAHDQPVVVRGRNAVVIRMDGGERRIALRVFLRERADREKRYEALTRYLERHRVGALVPFTYLRRGIRVGDAWYPALKMDWVEGERLDARVRRLLDDPPAIRALADEFFAAMNELARHNVAHGDIEPSNVLVTPYGLRLVDYDTTYAPGLESMGAAEPGHDDHQHPRRARHDFGPTLDHFSAWVAHVSLLALSLDPTLWRRHGEDGRLLFRREDFTEPEASSIFADLRALRGGAILAERMVEAIRSDPLTVPPLEELPLPPPAPPRLIEPAPTQGAPAEASAEPLARGDVHDETPRTFVAPLRLERASLVALGGALALLLLFSFARGTPLPLVLALALAEIGAWIGWLRLAHALHPLARERREALRRVREEEQALAAVETQLASLAAAPGVAVQGDATEAELDEIARREEAEIVALEREIGEALEAIQRRREELDAEERHARDVALRKHCDDILHASLQRHPLSAAVLGGDAAAADALARSGVRTAADVTPDLTQRVDTGIAAAALGWRRDLEARAAPHLPSTLPPEAEAALRARGEDDRMTLDAREAQATDEARSREGAIRHRHQQERAALATRADSDAKARAKAQQELDSQRIALQRQADERRRALAWAREEAATYDGARFTEYLRRVVGRTAG